MEERSIKLIFTDTDFKNRTVLNLITYNGYAELMKSDKVAALLDELWVGQQSSKCNGKKIVASFLV